MKAPYLATVRWERAGAAFTDLHYSRGHTWTFDGGVTIPASASPHIVAPPWSDPAAVDPEEAFVAALASCHLLWFLSIAAEAGFVVDRYEDQARGVLARDHEGKLAMTEVTLHPAVTFSGRAPSAADLAELHERAHEACFIANSVKTVLRVEPAVRGEG